MIEIYKKITGFKILPKDSPIKLIQNDILTETTIRPEKLNGCTYKLKTPLSPHALYITINNITLNENTSNEKVVPFEVFINSKNVEHFQYIVALTRLISAVFRKGGDIRFVVDELTSIFDPKGGYFKGDKYCPSLVAEIGEIIKTHLDNISKIDKKIAEKEVIKVSEKNIGTDLCPKCLTMSMTKMDGCLTCLNCGDSKCG